MFVWTRNEGSSRTRFTVSRAVWTVTNEDFSDKWVRSPLQRWLGWSFDTFNATPLRDIVCFFCSVQTWYQQFSAETIDERAHRVTFRVLQGFIDELEQNKEKYDRGDSSICKMLNINGLSSSLWWSGAYVTFQSRLRFWTLTRNLLRYRRI